MKKYHSLKDYCRVQPNVIANSMPRYRFVIYFSIFILLLLLLLFPTWIYHRGSRKAKYLEENNLSVAYRDVLEQNLEKLHQWQSMKLPISSRLKKHTQHFAIKETHSKRYRLRQHAPTRMFSSAQADSTKTSTSYSFNDGSAYSTFSGKASNAPHVLATRLKHPKVTIAQGEFIHAILETRIDSDLPGMIRALVIRPVYSYLGGHILVPAGSRLIGQYSSQTLEGINRVMVIWQRLLLPSGISIQIDSPGSGRLGAAGFSADQVDTHFLQRFGQATLLSLIGAGSANVGVNASDNYNAAQQYRSVIAESFQSSAQESLNKTRHIKPTLRLYQGADVMVFVARDLDFSTVIHHDAS